MKKIIKKIFLSIMVMSLLATSVLSVNVSAADVSEEELNIVPVVGVYNYSQVSPASSDTYYLGTCTVGNFSYEVNRYYGDWYAIFNMDLSLPCYKRTTAMTVSQTIGQSYSSQTSYEFSVSMGGTASAEIIDITNSVTNGMSYTSSAAFEIASGVSYHIEATDSVGYYKIGVCHDIYRHTVNKYYRDMAMDEYDMPIPSGIPYHALLFSTENDSGYRQY